MPVIREHAHLEPPLPLTPKMPIIVFFFIPLLFALLQGWAAHRIETQREAEPLVDAAFYIQQARLLHDEPVTMQRVLEFSLFPVFLSQFEKVDDTSAINSKDPKLLPIYAAQSLVLQVVSAAFLFCALIFIPGRPIKRVVISVLLGCILLGPQIVAWPSMATTEAMTLSATLLFACTCLADDLGRRWSPILVPVACCLLVLIRDPMIILVWMFGLLLLVNILFSKRSTRPLMIGAFLMLLVLGLATVRASLFSFDPQSKPDVLDHSQSFANILQFRILPDPQYRNFFVLRGLPISSNVMKKSGKPAWESDWFTPDSELSSDLDYIAYRQWLVTNGMRTYLIFLLTHPGYVLSSFFYSPNIAGAFDEDFRFSITDLLSVPFPGYGVQLAPYPQWLRDFLLAPFGWLIPTLYLIVASVRYIWQTATRQQASRLDIAAIAAGGATLAAYHTDAWDLWRHTVPFILLIYFSMITRTTDIVIERVGRSIGLKQTTRNPFDPDPDCLRSRLRTKE